VTDFEELLVAEATPAPRITRQKVLLCSACIALLVCVPLAVFSAVAAESSTTLLLIGNVTGFQIALVLGMVAVVAFVVLLWNASSSNWWLIVAIPSSVGAGLLLILALLVLPATATKVIPIQVAGCSTGYVAIERFAGVGNFVGVRDGIHTIKVHEYWADDYGMPFSSGTASVRAAGDELDIAYPGRPGFTVPILATSTCTP
jgi:hypothetical protein